MFICPPAITITTEKKTDRAVPVFIAVPVVISPPVRSLREKRPTARVFADSLAKKCERLDTGTYYTPDLYPKFLKNALPSQLCTGIRIYYYLNVNFTFLKDNKIHRPCSANLDPIGPDPELVP